ncbi:MAG: DGQHR domain-containing protein [Methylobacillus sp.]|jgi:DNA sulfur modification protein DndB|nr:DGQHR domain-containing protein [Methylobacillus sp.]
MKTKSSQVNPLALPALRGKFGDWTYYSAVIPLAELANRVSFDSEIHVNKELSSWIQRALKRGRAEEIAEYLKKQPERFFNSLVIALYGGTPEWVPLAVKEVSDLPRLEDTSGTLGVLRLSGEEKLFAVDGQHRLAGMKRYMEEPTKAADSAVHDLVSVLVVAHRVDKRERTRRLFTTLNKTAVPVSKMERIALDENDVMAIVVRRMVEENEWFQSPRVAMQHTNNLKQGEEEALTTIGNLYDILRLIFLSSGEAHRKELEYNRLPDNKLDQYYKKADEFFKKLAIIEPALKQYFIADAPQTVCMQHRTQDGGSVYFRPLGLALMSEVALQLQKNKGSSAWVKWMSALPKQLTEKPFLGTIWTHRNRIDPKSRVLCRDLLLYMCDANELRNDELKRKLSEHMGEETALPKKVKPTS